MKAPTWRRLKAQRRSPTPAATSGTTRWGRSLPRCWGAGLVLEEVSETRVSAWRRWPDLMGPCEEGYRFTDPAMRDMLPLQLVVVARRP